MDKKNELSKVIIPLIRQLYPSMIAHQLTGVQPMSIEVFTPWKVWFAWYPVTLRSGSKAWMKNIYRREPYSIFSMTYTNKSKWWNRARRPRKHYQYADVFDILRS